MEKETLATQIKAKEQEKTMGTEVDSDYCYYSKVLNKVFNTLDELKQAEKEKADKDAEQNKKSLMKKESILYIRIMISNFQPVMVWEKIWL